jgi:hypothetical protein
LRHFFYEPGWQRQQVERKEKSRTSLIASPKSLKTQQTAGVRAGKGSSYLRHQVNFVNFEIEFAVEPR